MNQLSTATTLAGPVDSVSTDLSRILRDLKLSGLKDTLPERLVMARHQQMGHAAFLELLLSDELSRRDSRSATLRAARAGLDAAMRLETWDDATDLSYDRMLLSDLGTLDERALHPRRQTLHPAPSRPPRQLAGGRAEAHRRRGPADH